MKNFTENNEEFTMIQFSGEHPANPEYGSVILSVKKLFGTFDDISQVSFIDDDVKVGKLLNYKKKIFGGYEVEIFFDTVFRHGLKYSANHFIYKDVGIIGLTQAEKESLHTIETQKELLTLLTELIIPSKKNVITSFAKTGFLCIPNENSDENISHFLGKPKHVLKKIVDVNGRQQLHLATFHLNDFNNDGFFDKFENFLSFYINIDDTENGWPQEKGNYCVLNEPPTANHSFQGEFEKAVNFDIKPILDLPNYNHSLLQVHNFSDEERERYDALRSVYMNLILGESSDTEFNKFLGYPTSIQNCVSYDAERLHHHRDYENYINDAAVHWNLLLQVSPYCKWFNFFDTFGDGTIYYMIRSEDFNSCNFDNCQVVIQNT